MRSNTHTHQCTQLTIVTNIIEREFVATAILSFSGSSVKATYGYLLTQASYSRFNQLFNSGQTGSASSNELLKCCREFSFQYNGLLYCRACVSSEVYSQLLATSDKRKEVIFHMTRRDIESTIKQFKSDYRSTQAVVRF